MRLVFNFALLVLLCGAASGHAIDTPSRPVETDVAVHVLGAEFGIFQEPGPNKPVFVPTRSVPLTEGQAYGWVILVTPTRANVRWREEFTLPAAPSTWGEQEPEIQQNISGDGRTSIKEGVVAPTQGIIFNSWAVAPGDPAGRYRIGVFIENQLVRTFEFEVK